MVFPKVSKLERRIAIAAAVVAATILAGWLALPLLVRTMLEREAASRGIRLEIEGVSVGGSGLELAGARFERVQSGARASAERVVVDASLPGLVFQGAAGVRRVSVRGLDAEIVLGVRDARSGEGEAPGRAARRPLPSIDVRDARVRLSDARGELARAELESATVEGRRAEIGIARIQLGGDEALASADGVRVWADVEARRLSRVEVTALDLSGLEDEEAVRALLERLRGLRGRAEDEAEGHATEEGNLAYSRMLERLDADFALRVRRAVLPHESDRAAFVLEDAGFERGSASKVRLFGGGRGPSASRAAFDVEVDAVQLRASGTVEVEHLPLDSVAGLLPGIPWHEPERGVLDANLRFEATSQAVIGFRGTLQMQDLGIDSPRLASDPVSGLDFSVAASGSWDVDARRLVVERGTFGLGEAKVEVQGAAVLDPARWSLSVRATLPRTGCNEAVHAFPSAILGDANEFQLRGTLAGDLRLDVSSDAPEALDLDLRVDDRCRFVEWPEHADPARFRAFFVHEALDPEGEPFDFETGPRTEVWTELGDVSPYLVAAVLAHEDASFFRHGGFSTFAIRGSLARNLAAGRFERGASTLTMQLAKNLFLNREKVLVRKLREVIYTWWLEKGFGKESTLELYLNVVEFGPFIYGIRNASLHYFGREPSELSPAEATFLATILPSPKTGAYHHERGELSRVAKNRIASLLKNMEKRELLSTEAAEYGLSEIETFRFHREGEPLPPPRTLPPTHPLFEVEPSSGTGGDMGADDFDPWGFP